MSPTAPEVGTSNWSANIRCRIPELQQVGLLSESLIVCQVLLGGDHVDLGVNVPDLLLLLVNVSLFVLNSLSYDTNILARLLYMLPPTRISSRDSLFYSDTDIDIESNIA